MFNCYQSTLNFNIGQYINDDHINIDLISKISQKPSSLILKENSKLVNDIYFPQIPFGQLICNFISEPKSNYILKLKFLISKL